MSPLDKLFWLRVTLGSGGGLLSSLLGFVGPNTQAYNGVFVAIGLYLLSYYLVRYAARIPLAPDQRVKLVTTGLGSFVILYLFTWILYNTLAAPVIP